MDATKQKSTDAGGDAPFGFYLRGMVISHRAHAFKNKEGQRRVIISHELATDPGLVELTEFVDPALTASVRLDGDEVVEYPHLERFKVLNLRAYSVDTDHSKTRIRKFDILEAGDTFPIPGPANAPTDRKG